MRHQSIPLRKLAVENLTVGRMEPVRFIEEAAAAGFGSVGLPLATATPVPLEHEIVGRPEVLGGIKQALKETGVTVLDIEAFVLAPGASVEAWRPVLETGAELGARYISVIGAPVSGPMLSSRERADLFGLLCQEAAGFQLRVGVECMLYRDVRTVTEALALIEEAGGADTGVILDVLHLHRAGTSAEALMQLPSARVAYAQLCDVASGPAPDLDGLPTEARSSRLHLAKGIGNLNGFLAALPESVDLAIEIPVRADAHLPTSERLRQAGENARHFLDGWAVGAES